MMHDELQAIQNNLMALSVDAFNAFGPTSDVASLLAAATNLIRDAKLIAANPKLKVDTCLVTEGVAHLFKRASPMIYTAVCGHQANPGKRVAVEKRVPTCEACIAAKYK